MEPTRSLYSDRVKALTLSRDAVFSEFYGADLIPLLPAKGISQGQGSPSPLLTSGLVSGFLAPCRQRCRRGRAGRGKFPLTTPKPTALSSSKKARVQVNSGDVQSSQAKEAEPGTQGRACRGPAEAQVGCAPGQLKRQHEGRATGRAVPLQPCGKMAPRESPSLATRVLLRGPQLQ